MAIPTDILTVYRPIDERHGLSKYVALLFEDMGIKDGKTKTYKVYGAKAVVAVFTSASEQGGVTPITLISFAESDPAIFTVRCPKPRKSEVDDTMHYDLFIICEPENRDELQIRLEQRPDAQLSLGLE